MRSTILFIQVVLCLVLLASLEQSMVEAKKTTTTTTKKPKTTTTITTKKPKTTTTTPAKKPKTITASPGFKCPSSNGAFSDPDTCKRYNLCVNGVATNLACGTLLPVFDPTKGRCALASSVPSCKA